MRVWSFLRGLICYAAPRKKAVGQLHFAQSTAVPFCEAVTDTQSAGHSPWAIGAPVQRDAHYQESVDAPDAIWFHSAVQRHRDMVFRIAFHYLRSSADADDICQDAFVALYRCGKQFEDDVHLKAWLIKTTCNLCKSEFRKIWRRSVDDLDTYAETLADPAESGDSVAEARELLGLVMKLPKNQRITIYLHYYEGYEAQEIAEMLGKPASTIRSWLARGRMRLARKLGEGVQS